MKTNELYDVSAELAEEFGAPGSVERENVLSQAWEEYNASVLLEARKKAHMTQEEVAKRIGKLLLLWASPWFFCRSNNSGICRFRRID